VTATDESAKPVSVSVRLSAGATGRSTIVLNAGTVKVTALYAPGHVADGTRVDLYQGSNDVTGTYADATGTATFIVTSGSYTVKSSLDAAIGPGVSVHVTAGGTAVLNAGILSLHVVNGAGHAVNDARVDIYKGATDVTGTYADAMGLAKFALNVGTYKVTVVNGKATVTVTVQITAGVTTTTTVRAG
jgi:hypothetical protein